MIPGSILISKLPRCSIFCNDIIHEETQKINKKILNFLRRQKDNKGIAKKRKLLFTFLLLCDKMYLVKIGVFAEKCRKSMGIMRMHTGFSKHFFVVFYQPFSLLEPMLV